MNVLNNIPEKGDNARENNLHDSPLSWKKICFIGAEIFLKFGAQHFNIHCSLYSPLRNSKAKPGWDFLSHVSKNTLLGDDVWHLRNNK